MTTILLIRHGHTDLVGNTLAGRSAGVHLSARGRLEVENLVRFFQGAKIGAVFSSPLERTLETARPIADELGLAVQTREDLTEIDYGRWTGRTIASLAEDPVWIRYNRYRSITRIPDGERYVDVQARTVRALEELRAAKQDGTLAVVSHGDVIRVALAHYLGMSLDMLTRIAVQTGSISGLLLGDFSPEVLFVNHLPARTALQGLGI